MIVMENIINKITSSKEISAVKDGFLALTPLTIINSFVILLSNIPFYPIRKYLENNFPIVFKNILPHTADSFYSFISLFTVFAISYSYSKKIEISPTISALTCVFSYLVFTPANFKNMEANAISNYIDSNGIFLGIMVALIIPKLIKYINNNYSIMKFPETVPSDVVDSLTALLPTIFVTIIVTLVNGIFIYNKSNIFDLFISFVNRPLLFFGANIFVISGINLFISLFWFFGFNGSYLFNSVMKPVYITLSTQNIEAIKNGFPPQNIITGTFQSNFVNIGGSGATLSLVFAIFLVSKSTNDRFIAKLAFIPSIFNINEPLVYGLPIILNFKYFIPFLICPVINTIVTYISMKVGLVSLTNGIQMPWTMPVFLSGFLGVGTSGVLLQVFLLIIDTLIYVPFVKKRNHIRGGKEQ